MDNTKPSEASELDGFISKYSPFLNEIRKRILFTVLVFIVAAIVGFLFYERIIKFLIDLLALRAVNIVFTSPFQFINLAISCGVATGLAFAFPLAIYQTFSFLRPALKNREYKMIAGFIPLSTVLFSIGFSFGILVMKWQIQLFLTKSQELGIGNILDISKLISTVLLISVVMGISFQLPIILLILSRLGIIKHNQLAKKRPWVYLGSFFFTILLPLDSILADVLLALPIVALFELTLLLDRIFDRRKAILPN